MIVLVLSNAKTNWLDILCVVIFFLFSALNIFISFKFKEEESVRVGEIVQAVEQNVDKVVQAAAIQS